MAKSPPPNNLQSRINKQKATRPSKPQPLLPPTDEEAGEPGFTTDPSAAPIDETPAQRDRRREGR